MKLDKIAAGSLAAYVNNAVELVDITRQKEEKKLRKKLKDLELSLKDPKLLDADKEKINADKEKIRIELGALNDPEFNKEKKLQMEQRAAKEYKNLKASKKAPDLIALYRQARKEATDIVTSTQSFASLIEGKSSEKVQREIKDLAEKIYQENLALLRLEDPRKKNQQKQKEKEDQEAVTTVNDGFTNFTVK